MSRRVGRFVARCLALAGVLASASGRAAEPVTVRTGEHDGFSRVVFTLPPGGTYRSRMIGDLLVLSFRDAGRIPSAIPVPRHMLSVTGGLDQAAIGVPAGLRAHVWQIDRRVIVDVFAGAQPLP